MSGGENSHRSTSSPRPRNRRTSAKAPTKKNVKERQTSIPTSHDAIDRPHIVLGLLDVKLCFSSAVLVHVANLLVIAGTATRKNAHTTTTANRTAKAMRHSLDMCSCSQGEPSEDRTDVLVILAATNLVS